jgi:hypothetical protein
MTSFIFGSKVFKSSVKVIVHGKGNLVEFESLSINMLERVVVLVLNGVFQGADRLGAGYFDRKDAT